MASKSSFFSKFLAFFLVLVIISGVGFLGYNLLSGSMAGMDMDSGMNMASNDKNAGNTTKNTDSSSSNGQMNMSDNPSKDTMNMSGSSSKQAGMNMGGSTTGNNTNAQYSTVVINAVLQNKDGLEKAVAALNDSLKLMTLDPFGVETGRSTSPNTNGSEVQGNNGQGTTAPDGTPVQGNTTVNVYTQNPTSQATAMQSMGTTYDTAKMERLHTSLYKVSVGVQLLNQLKDNLSLQLEQASMQITDPAQYYYNQYLITVQNKTKLSDALTYINEASSLANINPYVSQNGAVYDKEKMAQIHDSIYKLAQVVIDLNKINDSFSRQAITLGNTTQNYINNAQSMQGMDMTNPGLNFFGNISMTKVLNALVIVFIVIFFISIFGYINRLLKSPRAID